MFISISWYLVFSKVYTLVGIFMAIVIVVGGNNVRGKYGPFSKKDHNKDGHKNSN